MYFTAEYGFFSAGENFVCELIGFGPIKVIDVMGLYGFIVFHLQSKLLVLPVNIKILCIFEYTVCTPTCIFHMIVLVKGIIMHTCILLQI